MYKHFSDWLKNLDTGHGWYLTTEELETWLSWKPTRVPPPTHTQYTTITTTLKKKKKTCMSSQMPGEHVGFCKLSHSIC